MRWPPAPPRFTLTFGDTPRADFEAELEPTIVAGVRLPDNDGHRIAGRIFNPNGGGCRISHGSVGWDAHERMQPTVSALTWARAGLWNAAVRPCHPDTDL